VTDKWTPQPGEDLIDFPCSPDWVRHYASRGMTRDYPPEYYRIPDTMTVERIRELEGRDCANCYHHQEFNHCSCRDAIDATVLSFCNDWQKTVSGL
jgi:hypothetical protein